ncbi:hypothetical protein FNJ84_11885 [Paracoccus sp. M683]|uniref:hypothetical protein n=1 Tax=Paracoccus sp. M683 TaxID=2594268 RepID=UPI00117CBFAE|nr:hypothetical protein [Paracoccus sp. M683]TRW96941.1 hypothetical protein FNJ84_11885 [Paracoccus sp. M683]
MNVIRAALLLMPMLALAGCAAMQQAPTERPDGVATTAEGAPLPPEAVQAAAAITQAPPPRPRARATAAQLDTTTTEQRAAAAAPAQAAETRLGTTIASLGDATEPGFWIKTPLVKSRGIGRIVNPANGKSAKVDLIPLDGPASGGSQVSLPALQLLGVSLTDLPSLEVFRS